MSKLRQATPVADDPPAFPPPAVPTLTPDEADAAIRSGCVAGIHKALIAKLSPPPGALSDAHARKGLKGLGPSAEGLVRNYLSGSGGPDLAEVIGHLDELVLSAALAAATLHAARDWIIAHPGEIGSDANGPRRFFP